MVSLFFVFCSTPMCFELLSNMRSDSLVPSTSSCAVFGEVFWNNGLCCPLIDRCCIDSDKITCRCAAAL
eukprot:5883574-Heterocapsa_arctica.AAC.1